MRMYHNMSILLPDIDDNGCYLITSKYDKETHLLSIRHTIIINSLLNKPGSVVLMRYTNGNPIIAGFTTVSLKRSYTNGVLCAYALAATQLGPVLDPTNNTVIANTVHNYWVGSFRKRTEKLGPYIKRRHLIYTGSVKYKPDDINSIFTDRTGTFNNALKHKVFCKVYASLVENHPMYLSLLEHVRNGMDIIITGKNVYEMPVPIAEAYDNVNIPFLEECTLYVMLTYKRDDWPWNT